MAKQRNVDGLKEVTDKILDGDCPVCQGAGRIKLANGSSKVCKDCGGSGRKAGVPIRLIK